MVEAISQPGSRGPASASIEREVLAEARRHGIVIWLDRDGSYTAFVDDLIARAASGSLSVPVVGFRGSFLELLLALEPHGSGLDPEPLLIHMPGFNEDAIRQTPLLELYSAGRRFRKGLDTLIRETAMARVAPVEVEKFLGSAPTLEAADAWLGSAVTQSSYGLAAALEEFGPRMLADALAQPASLAPRVSGDEEVVALRGYILKLTGMDSAWEDFYPGERYAKPLAKVLQWLGAWLLAVEYVHDLTRPPHLPELQRLKSLSKPVVDACLRILADLRKDAPDAYVRLADEVEGFLSEELKHMTADDLGQVDTFREEENVVLAGAVAALKDGNWSKARAWVKARDGDRSFWVQRDQLRRWAWNLVDEAAGFAETLARHVRPLAGARSVDEAVERYAARAYEVDSAHRRFEQRRLALLDSRLPHYGALREVATQLRLKHRAWADQLTRDFAALCVEHGFLPSTSQRQRAFFEEVVQPLAQSSDKLAVFLIDAFRFEMATELVEELKGPGTSVVLKPRLAELPTITSVGMNVLAPVARGERLTVAGEFEGFKSGEFTVADPKNRARAMGLRIGNRPALLLSLADVGEATTAELAKSVKPHSLVVVHSREIDDAGEVNLGLPTFEATLRQIKSAWHHLQLAGVKNCVFTADHGFLIQDETAKVEKFGSAPCRRHVLDPHPRSESGVVSVSLNSLGYEGLSGHLVFRDDTAVFDTNKPLGSFVHGGNSLQERVIPVLTVTRARAETRGMAEYVIEAESLPDVLGLHRLRLRVVFARNTTTSLGFAAARSVSLTVRVPDRDDLRVILKDTSGPGEIKGGRLELSRGEAWTELFFGLEGSRDERVRVEVYHPDSIEKVSPVQLEGWFAVSGTAVPKTKSTPATKPADPPPVVEGWAGTIADEGIRRVFQHIEKHGAITEPEVTNLLGSPRAFRRFSLEFEQHLPKLPFRVRIESAEGGKRYVREGDA